ncbi:MAG: sigma 54-interacting transcriptional regulator [Opitutaceae bacterium]
MSKMTRAALSLEEREFAKAVARVNAANPFLPERIAAEKAALGEAFQARDADWNTRPPSSEPNRNVAAISTRCAMLLERVRDSGGAPSAVDRGLYEEVAGYWLYQTYAARFDSVILASLAGRGDEGRVAFYPAFKADVERTLQVRGWEPAVVQSPGHLFACAFQIRRAFHAIFRSLVGGSAPMARLRAEIWQSIFGHDLNRYRRGLYARMGDFSTLICGPSGTGKELVARALAFSRYLEFDPKRGSFGRDFAEGFFPLNPSALSPTLIESELFGHRRGAFTGALSDRAGWMEVCPSTGAVFLDEIGDVEAAIQVKLLRVLQSRTFQPLGSTESRRFEGKIVAATHRVLPEEIRAGRFREDFYFRLCSDQLTTPSLRAQLDDSPADLLTYVSHMTARLLEPEEVERFSLSTVTWIEANLGRDYPWPGNVRELEQCVRSLVLRGHYRPASGLSVAPDDAWISQIGAGRMTAEALLRRYTRLVHGQAGTVEETARRLDLDRRTVKARLTP